ncbi:MAG: DUF3147 family protein [Candidatus Thiodiazotropha lotti]|nr:DUF3147 family protein [Candidatus Thiodiazotropha lotti]
MMQYLVKVLITALLVVAVSEAAKRSSLLGGILGSIPLVSVIAIIWLYSDTGDIEKVTALANSIFWLVIPSLSLFISLPLLLNYGLGFYPSLVLAILITAFTYYVMIKILAITGVSL